MSEESFLLKYDGARLQSGPMSVAEIGPVFLALDELVKAIYRNVDPLSAEVPELQIVGVEQGERVKLFVCGVRFIGICRSGRERPRPFG